MTPALPDPAAREVQRCASLAASTAREVAGADPAERARWLESIAAALEATSDELVALADQETHLGRARLEGELAKTAANARYYARVGQRGDWMAAVVDIDAGIDLRRVRLPIGPVAVFGASNFPFQFGTVGHDTCSALAAGCPVVVKAHPAHPRLAARLALLTQGALADAGAPEGAFGMVSGFEAGLTLVDAPEIAAVGFTGSQQGGLALAERAAARTRPIPVYAEMGTVNPAVVTPAGAAHGSEVAMSFVDSFTLGIGQFCTKPGLLLVPAGSGLVELVAEVVRTRSGERMLTPGIAAAYRNGTTVLGSAGCVVLATGSPDASPDSATPTLVQVRPEDLRPGSAYLEECFGPVALIAEYTTLQEAESALGRLQPSLAGVVWGADPDDPDVPALVARLAGQVGRVVVNGWSTGVACTDAMHHGGPWPATSRPEASSVGAAALDRWTRPVAFQNVPDAALPPALRRTTPR